MPIELPRFFDWSIPGAPNKAEKSRWVFDLLMGERVGGKTPLKVGKGMHRLLMLFATDFYRPFRIAQLFSLLYPGESYHPVNSPPRVHQILNRLRVWFTKNHLPLAVEEKGNFYRLTSPEGFILRVPASFASSDPALVHLEKLKEVYAGKIFSAIEAGKALGISGRTVLRLMEKGLESNLIVRTGKGAATRYQFSQPEEVMKKAA